MSEDRDWELFKQKLKAKTEIDLDLYKEPQMKRRINNLITRAGYKECSEYFDHVCGNKDLERWLLHRRRAVLACHHYEGDDARDASPYPCL